MNLGLSDMFAGVLPLEPSNTRVVVTSMMADNQDQIGLLAHLQQGTSLVAIAILS